MQYKKKSIVSVFTAVGSILDLGATAMPRMSRPRLPKNGLQKDREAVMRDWQKVRTRLARG
jgi:hypothetical protein